MISIGYYHKRIYRVSMILCSPFFTGNVFLSYKEFSFRVIPKKASSLHIFFIWLGPLQKRFTPSILFTALLSSISCMQNLIPLECLSSYNTLFSLKDYKKVGIFLPPLLQNSRSLHSICGSAYYTGYAWEMCKTVGVCFILQLFYFLR